MTFHGAYFSRTKQILRALTTYYYMIPLILSH